MFKFEVTHMNKLILLTLASLMAAAALAKLPAQSDEAKAKAAEAAAKTAWAAKVDGYKLCKAQDKVVAQYNKSAKPSVKAAKPAASTCVDPGPFVYTPIAAAAPAAAPAATATAMPAKQP